MQPRPYSIAEKLSEDAQALRTGSRQQVFACLTLRLNLSVTQLGLLTTVGSQAEPERLGKAQRRGGVPLQVSEALQVRDSHTDGFSKSSHRSCTDPSD